MELRDLLDRCANDVMVTIYIHSLNNPRGGYTITGTVDSITLMVSDTTLDYLVGDIDLDDNTLEIRLREDDCDDIL